MVNKDVMKAQNQQENMKTKTKVDDDERKDRE